MINIINSEQAEKIDKLSTTSNLISEKKLIDNAGKAIAYHIIEKVLDPFHQDFLCIAGFGKNGLDAIVCNYYLKINNINSQLLILNPKKINPDYLTRYLPSNEFYGINDKINYTQFSWIVEGIFGTGLNRDIEGATLDVIKLLNTRKNIISIDISSGVYADTGKITNIAVKSETTISFAFPKAGHFLSDGFSKRGKLFVYPIGHSDSKIDSCMKLIEKKDVLKFLKPIDSDTHKYTKGKILSLSGSASYSGAAILSSKASVYSGTGIIKQLIPLSLHKILSKNDEVIDVLIDDSKNGFLSLTNYKELESYFNWPDSFVLGPGLSDHKEAIKLTKKILANFKGNCILDASGFLSFNKNFDFSNLPKKTILTPHYGELSKILNISVSDLKNNTKEIISDISHKLEDRILVLKGPNTLVANGSGDIYIISNGNHLLSTAGSGDVLTGIIASYVTFGYSLEEASVLGVYIHAECSKLLFSKGYENISATQIIDVIPKVQFLLREGL